MERSDIDAKIAEMAKTLYSYCIVRTSDHFEAEDLAQDIILQIYKSVDNIRNADSFYSFVWAVAGNVYKQWCKKKLKSRECELSEDFSAEMNDEDDFSDMYLLRRELSLLAEKYRKAVILYYIENKSCLEISKLLSTSESMVKYLLFKSRQLLKEGMSMERNYGEKSYNPKGMSLMFWGNGANHYYHLCESKISQNILFACYNDKLTAEQISLEIGVALPYMEDKLKELSDYEILKKEGNRYYTNIVIFTKEFACEVATKTANLRKHIAESIIESIGKYKNEIRAIGFTGADMNDNSFNWQMVSFILYHAVINKLQGRINIRYPKDKFGTECFVWGEEVSGLDSCSSQYSFGISNMTNSKGDYIQFMDFPINGEMVHHYCFNRQEVTNVFLDIAKGKTEHFSENDKAIASEMVRRGYVISDINGLRCNVPIFTEKQYQELNNLFTDTTEQIAKEAEGLMETVANIMKNHMPVHLKKMAKDMAFLRLFEDAISAPVASLCEQKYLLPYSGDSLLPTTYIILK